MRIRTKLFLINSMVVIALLASSTFFLETYSRKMIFEQLKENSGYSLAQLAENIDNMFRSYEQIMDFLYMNGMLQERLTRQYSNLSDAYLEYFDHVLPVLESVRNSKEVAIPTIYSDNATMQVGAIKPLDEIRAFSEQSGCSEPVPKSQSLRIWQVAAGSGGESHLRLTQRLNHLNSRACLFVSIEFHANLLTDLIKRESQKIQFIVAMPQGEVVLDSQAAGFEGSQLADQWYHEALVAAPRSAVVAHEGMEYLLTKRELQSRNSIRGVQVASLVPLEELAAGTKAIRQTALALFLAIVAVFVVVNYGTSAGLTRRLTELAYKMRKTDAENFQPIDPIKGSDEVSQLAHMFNGMMHRIGRLIREVYESELSRKELQLRTKESEIYALQTQINPHYLFNTLNAIQGNLLERGDKENAEVVNLLAKSFRNVLARGGQVATLAEELDIVITYLKIQTFRFSDRLAYEIEIPPAMHRLQVPKLALQTLVENAIVHGLEPNAHRTMIRIRAEALGNGRYSLTVEDDGPGIEPGRLAQIRAWLETDSPSEGARHIGLRNVQQRLRFTFGDAYGVRIYSEHGKGTKLVMILPDKEA